MPDPQTVHPHPDVGHEAPPAEDLGGAGVVARVGAPAQSAAAFALAGLDEATMVVASDASYYTWTSRSVHELLDAGQVQAVGLHVNLTRDDAPHVLFRALEPERMVETADEPVEVLRARLEQGLRRMKHARARRPAPARGHVDAPAWHAATLRWLFEADRYGLDLDATRLRTHLERLLAGPDPVSGALCDAPANDDDAPRPSLDVVDVDVAAAVPAAIDLLRELAARAGTERHAVAADDLVRRHAGARHAASPAPEPGSIVPGHLRAASARV